MDRKEQLLKYLDKELTPDEKQEVENLLASDSLAREQLEEIRVARQKVIAALGTMNPADDVEVPVFYKPSSHRIFTLQLFRYAASVALMAGLAVSILLLVTRQREDVAGPGSSSFQLDMAQKEALDCYISPNRCWNKRELPLIIIEIK